MARSARACITSISVRMSSPAKRLEEPIRKLSAAVGSNTNATPFRTTLSEILQTYAFKMGLSEGRFAYATAADLVQSAVSVILILVSNKVAKKITGEGIF